MKYNESIPFDPMWCSIIAADLTHTGGPRKRFIEEYESNLCYRRCAKELIADGNFYGVTVLPCAKRTEGLKIAAVLYYLLYADKAPKYTKLVMLFGKEYGSVASLVSEIYKNEKDGMLKLAKRMSGLYGSEIGNVAVFAIFLLASPESYLEQNRMGFSRLCNTLSQMTRKTDAEKPLSEQEKFFVQYGMTNQKNFSDLVTNAVLVSGTNDLMLEDDDGDIGHFDWFSFSNYGVSCSAEMLSTLALLDAGVANSPAYIMSRQQAAISNFLGMNEQGINDKVNDVLQGNLREIVSDMTVDQILTNRKQMALSVIENARPDLAKMGLEVVTFNVQDIRDAIDAQGHNHGVIEAIGIEQEELVKKQAEIARAQAARDVACAKADAEMAANAKEVEAQTAIAQRNNELQLAKAKLKAEADKAAADADAAGRIQMNLRAKEIKEAEADAEIAKQKKMVDLAAQEAEVQQRKLDAEVRKQADADLYRRQKEAEAKKYEAERAAEAQKFAKQQEAEGIEMVGKAEAEAIRQKGLAEAEAMKQKAEAYKQYNDAAVAEMLIKVLPDIAKSVAQPLSSIDKVSIIGGDASGVSGVSGNVPVLMAQTMQTVKEATGIDMGEIVRANSIQAKTDRNIHIDGVELDEPKSHITSERVEDGWMFHEKDPITGEDKTSFRPDFTDEEKAIMDAHAKAAEKHATTNKTNPYKKKTGPNK